MAIGLTLIFIGSVIFNYSQNFIVSDARLLGTTGGLILALIGVAEYAVGRIKSDSEK